MAKTYEIVVRWDGDEATIEAFNDAVIEAAVKLGMEIVATLREVQDEL